MITDFIRMAEESLAHRQKDYLESLVATSADQDKTRGIIQGLTMAQSILHETAQAYNAADSDEQAEEMARVAPVVLRDEGSRRYRGRVQGVAR